VDTGIIDTLLNAYIAIGDAAIIAISPSVMYVFVSLGVIGLTWAHLKNAISQRESPVTLLIVQFMLIGFFVWLLQNWTALTKILMAGMVKMGLLAGGNRMSETDFLHPSKIVAEGIRVAAPLIDAVGFWGWLTGSNIILGISMVIVVMAFCVLSLQVLVAIVEFKLGVIWSFFMVALGIFNGTSFAAQKALGYVFATGIKLFAVATVVSIGGTLIATLGVFADPAAPTYTESIAIAFGSVVLAALAWFIPAKVAGVISGGPSLGAGAAVGTAAALAATAAVAGMGGAAVTSAATKASAGTNALRAASTGGSATRGGLSLPVSSGPVGRAAGGGAGRGGSSAGSSNVISMGRDNLSSQMKANPMMAANALETMNRIEQAHAKTVGKGGGGAAAEHARAQAYRGLAWDIGDAIQTTNPELSNKIDSELGRIEAMKFEIAKAGVSPQENSAMLAEEYRNVTTRALNLDGGGGFDTPALSTALSPEGRAQNAALASSLGVGDEIRSMAAQGRSTRQIAEGLGDRLSPVNAQADRLGEGSDANLHRMAVVQAYKDQNGIPNPNAEGFKAWAAAEKKIRAVGSSVSAETQAATGSSALVATQSGAQSTRSSTPTWAQNTSYTGPTTLLKIPANINAMVPRDAEKSAGMNADNVGAKD
jgi:type IV secretion system protein TrbL